MAEYIEKENLIKYIDSAVLWSAVTDRFQVLAEIKAFEKADVAPIVHGKWIWNPNGMDWGLGAWQCSECCNRNSNLPVNHNINPLASMGSKYCPNCGAKMDLEEGK